LPNCHAPLIERRFACNVDGANNLCLDTLEMSGRCLEVALLRATLFLYLFSNHTGKQVKAAPNTLYHSQTTIGKSMTNQ
jgi:hypothetical protein